MRKTLAMFGLMAGALCAHEAAAQEWLNRLPRGGLQISCTGKGEDAKPDYISFYFNMQAEVDPMLGAQNIRFDKIEIDPAKKEMEFTLATPVSMDRYDGQLYSKAAKADTILLWNNAQYLKKHMDEFIKISHAYCLNPKAPAELVNGLEIVPVGMIDPLTQTANKVKKELGYTVN